MIDVIKESDIGEPLIQAIEWKCKHVRDKWDWIPYSELIAAILNAAIDEGIVSPPCHVIRFDDGDYLTDADSQSQIYIGPGKGDGTHCEHYRGQTVSDARRDTPPQGGLEST